MNYCKPEKMGTKEYGKLLMRIEVFKDGRVPAKEASSWRIEGQKRRISTKEYQRHLKKFAIWRTKDCEISSEKRCCRVGGVLPKEEGDVIREYEAMHEEHFDGQLLKERWERKGRNNNGNRQGDQRREGQK